MCRKVPTKDGLLVSLDGHIAPTNINGNYYWLDKSGNNNNAKLVNMALNDLSGYNSEKKDINLMVLTIILEFLIIQI